MQKPKKLCPGDKVAAVSLSWGGPGTFPHRYEAGKKQLESEFGVRVVEMPHTLKPADWLSKNPRARADDLMQAFADKSIKAVISTIGGDDSIRILPYLDLSVIRANPKVFMGYSDTTNSHFACFKAGLISFYGPSFMAGFGENAGLHPYLIDSVKRCVFSSTPVGEVSPNQSGWTVEHLDWANPANQSIKRNLRPSSGWNWLQGEMIARGHLIGGCIEIIDWLRGTEFWPSKEQWKGAILFLESSEEAPSPEAVKRMLRSIDAAGALRLLNGILVGRPGGANNPAPFADYDKAILQAVREEAGLVNIPIVTQMDFGHTDPMMTMPLGVEAEIDCLSKKFSICENAVVD